MLGIKGLTLRGVRILKSSFGEIQTATLMSRATRGKPVCLPPAYPYEEKSFNIYNEVFDCTMIRACQENAKVVVVEGPIAVGKSAFCKVLAEEFDLKYFPQPTMDEFLILPSGYDLRQHDDELPDELRSYDHKNFCLDPKNAKASRFQMDMIYLRFYQYLEAMRHLLNTGQGVVLERSYWSDYVFTKAMCEQKYVSKEVLNAYQTVRLNSSTFFPNPHLIIYLDIPVPVVQERIRTRNYSYEQNAPALTNAYLESLEKYWKQDYLKEARESSEILIYDWSDGGEIDIVIDDIEKIDFDTMRRDRRFKAWWITRRNLSQMRMRFTNNPSIFGKYFQYPNHTVDELYIPAEIAIKRDKLLSSIPECQYDKGYNPKMGDSIWKILFGSKIEDIRKPKYHLRYNDFIPEN